MLVIAVNNYYSSGFHLDYTTQLPKMPTGEHLIVSREEMEQHIKDNKLVEYDRIGNHYLGTSVQQIKVVMDAGKTCLLYIQPQVCDIYLY